MPRRKAFRYLAAMLGGPDRSRSHRGVRPFIGLAVSVVAVAGCVWWALRQDTPRFPDGVGGVSLLALSLGMYALNTLARGLRWDAILGRAHVGHQRADAYALTVVGYMGNTILPARGGEALRVVLLAERSGASRVGVVGSIIPERLLDGATLIGLYCVLAATHAKGVPGGRGWAWVGAGVLFLGIGALAVYLRLRIAGRFERFAARIRPVARASRLLASPVGLALAALTVAVWVGEGLVLLLVARSVDVHMTLAGATVAVVAASLAALVPALPGYVGTFDAALLFVLHALSVRGGAATGLLLLYRFVVFVPITITGLGILVGRYTAGDLLRGRVRRDRTPEAASSISVAS